MPLVSLPPPPPRRLVSLPITAPPIAPASAVNIALPISAAPMVPNTKVRGFQTSGRLRTSAILDISATRPSRIIFITGGLVMKLNTWPNTSPIILNAPKILGFNISNKLSKTSPKSNVPVISPLIESLNSWNISMVN